MSAKNDNINPDLFEAVDSLLEDIEETTQSFTPEKDKAVDTSALVDDIGTIIAGPEPEPEPEAVADSDDSDTETEPKAEPESEPIDSIENAKQALDALEEVESQAEELVAQSIDALLDDAQVDTEAAAEAEMATEPQVEPEPTAEVDQDEEIDTEDLLASIDELLENSDDDDQQGEDQPEAVGAIIAPEEESTPAPQTHDETLDEIVDETAALENTTQEVLDEPVKNVIEEITEAAVEPSVEPVSEIAETDLVAESLNASSDALDDSMDMLDSALSEAAGDMLDGDFETEEGELVTGEAVASAIEEALEAEPKPGDDSDLLGDAADNLLGEVDEPVAEPAALPEPAPAEPVAETQTETAPEPAPKQAAQEKAPEPKAKPAPDPDPVAQAIDPEVQSEIAALEETQVYEPTPIPMWFERGVEIIRPKIDKIDPLKGKTIDAIAMVLGTIIVAVMTHATPIVAMVVVLLSKPLAKQSPEIRNAVGYIAMWTGFLAVVLWVYLLMFRAPSIPTPDTAPSRVINADESLIVQPVIQVLP